MFGLESCLEGLSHFLITRLSKKSEHVLLVCLNTWLVEWIYAKNVTADTASLLEEIEESTEVVLVDALDRECKLWNATVDVCKLSS